MCTFMFVLYCISDYVTYTDVVIDTIHQLHQISNWFLFSTKRFQYLCQGKRV